MKRITFLSSEISPTGNCWSSSFSTIGRTRLSISQPKSHVDRSIHGPDDFITTNVVGTLHLLEAARSYRDRLASADRDTFRFLHISTDEVFGTLAPDDPAFCESTAYAPNSPYAASKAASDHLVRAWHHTYGLQTLTVNSSNNYGPYQFPEKLIPLIIHHALSGKPLPIYGDGRQVRDWVFVNDTCRAIAQVLLHGKVGECYAIGGRSEMTNREVVEIICHELDQAQPRQRRQLVPQADDVRCRPARTRPKICHRLLQDRTRTGLEIRRNLHHRNSQDHSVVPGQSSLDPKRHQRQISRLD